MTPRTSPYRAALIGCGRIGADFNPPGVGSSRIQSHAQAYTEHPQTQLVAAFDLDSDRLHSCGERWHIRDLYLNLEAMLHSENIDLLSISTPPDTHLPIMGDVLQSSSPAGILLEKPIASSIVQADQLLALAEESRTKIAVNYIRRYPPYYERVREKILDGELGEIQHVRVAYTKGVMNNASHAIDLLRFFFGDPCETQILAAPFGLDEPDPTLHFRLKFLQGFEAWFSGLDASAYNIFELDIIGTTGRLLFMDQGHICQFYPVADTYKAHGFLQLETKPVLEGTHLGRAIFFAVDQLVAAIENDVSPPCTLTDGCAALKISTDLIAQSKVI